MKKFILKGKTFGKDDYHEEIENIGDLYIKLNELILDSELRHDRVLTQSLIIETIFDNNVVEETPILIGHLNRNYGYEGYELIPKGTEVFELQDKYFFERKMIKNGVVDRCRFYKKTLKEHINFI